MLFGSATWYRTFVLVIGVPMKRCILGNGLVSITLTAAMLSLSCQRSLPAPRQPAGEIGQSGASNAATRSIPLIPPTAEVKPVFIQVPTPSSDAEIEKEDTLWKDTPEYKAVEDDIERIYDAAGARQARGEGTYLSSNETATVIVLMQNPYFRARAKAVIAAAIGTSEPARSTLLPHVIGLLSDPVWRVRRMAADTLGEIGDRSMIPLLEPLLSDRPEVAKLAQRAISKIEQRNPTPVIR